MRHSTRLALLDDVGRTEIGIELQLCSIDRLFDECIWQIMFQLAVSYNPKNYTC